MKGANGMKPSYIINKHSSLGVPCIQFVSSLDNTKHLLLSGGNDGYLNLWCISMTDFGKKFKQNIPQNHVCLEDELRKNLLDSLQIGSKLSAIHTTVFDEKMLVVFTDQTATVKMLTIC